MTGASDITDANLPRALRRRGFATISSYDYGLLTRDIPEAASVLGKVIEELAVETGYERIHVVGQQLLSCLQDLLSTS